MTKLKILGPAAAVAGLLALGGCATKGDIESLRSEIAGLRSSIEFGRRQGDPGRSRLAAGCSGCGRSRGLGQRCQPEG